MRPNRMLYRIGVVAVAMLCLFAQALANAAPAAAADNSVILVNNHSRKCLEVYAFSLDNGGNVVQWDCWRGPNQRWVKEDPDGNGWFQLRNVHSGKCLEVYAFSQDNGGDVVQWDCWNSMNQQWRYIPICESGFCGITHELRNMNSGKCADVFGFSQSNGGDVVQWTCHLGTNQRWHEEVGVPPIIR